MKQGLRELQPYDLAEALERALFPRLAGLLQNRAPGHCMRVTDLDSTLMARLCGRLRAEIAHAQVVILGNGASTRTPDELTVSSTKLVEVRNPLPDGTLRPPLMVFIPNHIRASAEDSFGVATFEAVQLGDVYGDLARSLVAEVPSGLRGAVSECLRRLTDGDEPWTFADKVAVVRFLLTAKINGFDADAIGAALYELGLVPDFELLLHPERAPARIDRNRKCVEQLTWSSKTERGRVLDLELAERAFRIELGNFVAEAGLEDPRAWTRRIVLDQSCWGLAFHRWEFEDGGEAPDEIYIGDVQTTLPVVDDGETDERLEQLVGQTVLPLGKTGVRKFNVTFRVAPLPAKVEGLAKFTIQVVSKERGPVGLVRKKSAWKGNRAQANVSFTRLNKVDWEEGWHFIRVLALTEDGDLIPLVDDTGEPVPWAADDDDEFAPRPNESDLFYVLPEGGIDVDPPQRAVQREDSLVHARTRLRFTALIEDRDPDGVELSSVAWSEKRSRGRAAGTEMLEVKFGRDGTMNVPVSRALKLLEQRILARADGPLSWRIPVSMGAASKATGDAARWPEGDSASRFLGARTTYFEAVRAEPKELVTQGADVSALRPLIVEYATAYQELVQSLVRRAESGAADTNQALADLRKVLALDTVTLAIRDHRRRLREAVLVAPTHPLRALWLATWAHLGDAWLQAAKGAPNEFAVPTRDALLRHLAPLSFPPVLPTSHGRLLTAVDNLHPYWTLYAPAHEKDPRSLVGDVCSALGLPEPAIGGSTIDGAYLASRIRRYLVQHPYVRSLVINAFNAGRAGVLADTLLQLQREPAFADMRYDVRLFVPDADAPGVGEALSDLLSPTLGASAREADAFSTPTESHLRPKLALAVRPTAEFRSAPEEHAAHISMLFDLFPAEEVGASRASLKESAAAIHGLVQDFQVDYRDDHEVIAWSRQPRHGFALPLEGAEELTDLLSVLPAQLSSATATVATGEADVEMRPVITLALDSDDRAILHQVHEVSDWVFTLDRNMGIEFFDHGGVRGRPDYLIDHSPDVGVTHGHRLTITSRSIAELEAMLRPVLEQYRLKADGRHAVAILDQLRSLSGRLALKLISSPTQRAEALGLALSRMYLEHQGVFTNQVVVPLDAHLELYRVLKKSADELGDEVSFKRTDLALFDLDAKARTITSRLVEVKCYNQVGDLGAFNALKDGIAEQIAQSEEVISYHFDPHRSEVDRPDRMVKTRELVNLLEFYLERATRYRAMSEDAAEEARFFLRTLEDGYRLDFTRAALIFDFDKPGTEPAERENGIEYHRIGVDLIGQLVEAAAPEELEHDAVAREPLEGEEPVAARSIGELTRRREKAPSVPTLDEAAFLGRERDRSISWEGLRARRTLGEEKLHVEPPDPEPRVTPTAATVTEGPPDTSDTEAPNTAEAPPESSPDTADPEEDAPLSREGTRYAESSPEPDPQPEPDTKEGEDVVPGDVDAPAYDVLLGVSGSSPQYGVLGELSGRTVAIDLNHTHTISLFGVQGGGKSYTLGTVAEMASLPIPRINVLPKPLATVIFHYSPTMDYEPEFTSMVHPNSDEGQLAALRERYGAEPKALTDVLLLVPEDKLDERREEYPGIDVRPLKFAASELQASHWRFLMGAVGNQANYIRQLNRIMKRLRDDLTLAGVRQGVDDSHMPDHIKTLAHERLEFAGDFIDDELRLGDFIRPGRLIIVDIRDEFIEKDQALGLFVVLLQLFADATHEGKPFNKLVVFDEAHKYIDSPDLVAGLVEVVREMRHKGTSIMVASQDPPSVPVSLIELSSQVILHKFNSPAWLKHIQKANAALGGLTAEKMAHLRPGEAYVWSSKATDDVFCQSAIKVKCRPRVTQHGGATKTAVGD
ncbi:MAG TPA: hypothetical protein RMH85_24470 [Polyangiaceae bacterium LLY-WYZ-15_(1-7)]|nr:hypothetical protein [Sandaracinus sp.]HJK91076.1 hypothetical protein [Polyangiaceae bacterium LLY-WYZ-15_(1-7)]MBJ74210.1 hypothetical protein [Sandaracinus sp.]HJL02363.1 hypothetical protein [Polyangiaceae bacterium LLY-WYZ-15_(1-7)]HJL11653.1 hypothetical protein [Polyangiaceae bacterium LLY-WYZ-15_(1-7)]